LSIIANYIKIILLYPFAFVYGCVTFVRNKLFDFGIWDSYLPSVPTIGVGNLAVGGTGKTPFILFLVEQLLKNGYTVAVLSRGYGRNTKGMLTVEKDSLPIQVGDEPLLIKQKFEKITVIVSEKRINAVKFLENQKVDFILLDDNFQHRYVKTHFQFLLTRQDKFFFNDYVLPAGMLREHKSGVKRADAVIITNSYLTNINLSSIKKINQYKNLPIYFSQPKMMIDVSYSQDTFAIAVAGIAYPLPFISFVASKFSVYQLFQYKDHYNYTLNDLENWLAIAEQQLNVQKKYVIVCTEKDWVKISRILMPKVQLKINFAVVKLEIEFNDTSFIFDIIKLKN